MKVYSWGANTNGQLGHNYSSEQIPRPLKVVDEIINSELNGVQESRESSPAVLVHGGGTQVLISIRTTPSNSTLIHLGVDTSLIKNSVSSNKLFSPKIITKELGIQAISCGWEFNLVLTTQNVVYSFGENKYGQLGRLSDPSPCLPIPDFRAIQISAGLRHAAGISLEGDLYIWGDNSKFKVGPEKIITSPLRVSEGIKFVGVKCGKCFVLALDDRNQFWGLGSNKFGELGPELPFLKELTKLGIKVPGRVVQFECGWSHTLVLLEDLRVVSWGRNNFSQLGRRTGEDWDPESGLVEDIHEPIGSICCGSEHSLALSEDRTHVYAWGWNEHENCGVKSSRVSVCERSGLKVCEDCVLTPVIVDIPEDRTLYIGCGNGNGFAVCQ